MDINDIKVGDIFLIHVLLTGEQINPPIVARVKEIEYSVSLSDYVIYWEILSGNHRYFAPHISGIGYWGQNFLFSTFKKSCELVKSMDKALAHLL